MLTDSHTHLNSPQLFPNYEKHIQDFIEQWWVWLSIIWTHLQDSITAIEICRNALAVLPNNWQLYIGATIGYHPEFARDCDISGLEKLILRDRGQSEIPPLATNLDSKARSGWQNDSATDSKAQWWWQPVIIGIGEIGTDLYREPYHAFYEEQKKAFHDQCILGQKYNLPIIIHSRNDFTGTIEVLQSVSMNVLHTSHSIHNPFKIYFHCRWYTTLELEVLHNLIKHNQNLELYIGFCGNISYPKAQDLRDSLQYCLDNNMNVLIETDAPYLAAQAIRGQQNTPAKIIHTYEYISDYFHIPMEELQKKTHDNFMSLYYPMSVIAIPIKESPR